MASTLKVGYERLPGDTHKLSTGSAVLGDLTLDYTNIPEAERGGTSVKLLAGAALYCFSSTLSGALNARAVKWSRISGEAEAVTGKDEAGRGRVLSLRLSVTVQLPEDYADTFERCKKIMRSGCLITASLEGGMDLQYDIKADYI